MDGMKIQRMPFERIEADLKAELDLFNIDHGGTVFHETKFNGIASQSFGTELSYLIARAKDEIVGICPCHAIRRGYLTNSYSNMTFREIPYGGWVCDGNPDIGASLYKKLPLRANESLTCVTSPFHAMRPFRRARIRYQTALIALDQAEEMIMRASVSSNTRHNINRAAKKGVRIVGVEKVETFLELYKILKSSVGVAYDEASLNFLRGIHNAYKDSEQAYIVGAEYEGELISAMLCLGNVNLQHAWVAGRIADLPGNIYQNELMWWKSILEAKNRGSRHFDLCVIEQERLPGIARFKMGFSKKMIDLYGITSKPLIYSLMSRAQRFIPLRNASRER